MTKGEYYGIFVDEGFFGVVHLVDDAIHNPCLLFYPDGSVRFRHFCDRGERGIVICAPELQIGEKYGDRHKIVEEDPITITGSLFCPDCMTHGFVYEGRWVEI